MFDVHNYLRSEFKRYYPKARIHVLTTNGGETIDVGVIPPNLGHAIINYRMAVGSDDGYFEFTSDTGRIVTIPFAPEMAA